MTKDNFKMNTANTEQVPEKRNTKISYLYRDGSNYKCWNTQVLSGVLTEEQIQEILACCDGEWFIPEQVGLPADRLDEYDRNEDDTVFFELSASGFTRTDEEPTVDITAEELYRRFLASRGNWNVYFFA